MKLNWNMKRKTNICQQSLNTEVILLSDLDERPGHNSAIGWNRTKIVVTVQVIVLPADLNKHKFLIGQL